MKLTFVYIASIVLLSILHLQREERTTNFVPQKSPHFIELKRHQIRSKFKNKKMAELLISYVSGDKRRLSRKIKNAHKTLTLYHLFTPSGIHLSSLYLFLFPLLFLIRKKSKQAHLIVSALICLPMFFLPKFYSIKRICTLRLFSLGSKYISKNISLFSLFIFTFLIDLFIGTFESSKLSFAYSFLFLGIIISMINRPKIFLPFALLGGQIIISYFQSTPLAGLGFLFGFALTSLFSLLFPILFLYFFFPSIAPTILTETALSFFWQITFNCHHFVSSFGFTNSSIPLLILIVILSIPKKIKLKATALALLLIIHTNPILNLPRNAFRTEPDDVSKQYVEKNKISKIKKTRRGYKIESIDGETCYAKLYNGFYGHKCYIKF